ncbi:AAA family ATPase [Streptomyces telluris]|uniref:ATP-binding protein n=1 Tax=Streptomyces telluris TaxID=2720021 RepID=A0A9X2RQ53_9ACTN|nr:AAA family ATPase [Streptomyces telluris]MCQ8774627.1 ATP-binding protein [Streptomyces telluris]
MPAPVSPPASAFPPAPVARLRPEGLVDLRAPGSRAPAVLSYPAGSVVVVSGLPGSGKSTLLRRWSPAAPAVDPRTAHERWEARMPDRLPYALYRPCARLEHFFRIRAAVRSGRPVLVHDCGSRPWMRRWLAREAGLRGHELHLVLLDVGAAQALEGQRARGRRVRERVFARHDRGLRKLLGALDAAPGRAEGGAAVPAEVAEAASLVLLGSGTREHVSALEFRGPRVSGEPRPGRSAAQ